MNMQFKMPATKNDLTVVSLLKMLALAVCGDDTAFLYYHSKSRIVIQSKSLSLNRYSNIFSWAMAVRKSDFEYLRHSLSRNNGEGLGTELVCYTNMLKLTEISGLVYLFSKSLP